MSRGRNSMRQLVVVVVSNKLKMTTSCVVARRPIMKRERMRENPETGLLPGWGPIKSIMSTFFLR